MFQSRWKKQILMFAQNQKSLQATGHLINRKQIK